MKTTRQNKFLYLTFVAFFGLTKNTIPQNIKPPTGKYCEDLGFGWQCVDFKADGKCKITDGHSYWTNKFNGKWTTKADTIMVISFSGKTSPSDTFYYYFKSDSLYSISYQDKIAIRGKALVKQD